MLSTQLQQWPKISWYYPIVCLEEVRKTTKTLRGNKLAMSPYLSLESAEYET
jgi:hypothetical protein